MSAPANRPPDLGLDDKILEIMHMMTSGQWLSGVSIARLAAEWGKSVATVQKLAVDAGRMIRLSVGTDREAILGAFIGELEGLGTDCRRMKPEVTVRAIELRARLLKLVDTPREQEPRMIPAKSAKEALEFVMAMIPELQAKVAEEESIRMLEEKSDE